MFPPESFRLKMDDNAENERTEKSMRGVSEPADKQDCIRGTAVLSGGRQIMIISCGMIRLRHSRKGSAEL